MNYISLTILHDKQTVAKFRADDLEKRIKEGTLETFIPNTGSTPIPMWDIITDKQLDLSEITLVMLDELLSTGTYFAEDPRSYKTWLQNHISGRLPDSKKPRIHIFDADITSCQIIDEQLEIAKRWGGLTKDGSILHTNREIYTYIRDLAKVIRACEDYSQMLNMLRPDLASLGVGPIPYPHSALNCDYTHAAAKTGLRVIDEATKKKLMQEFGEIDKVPKYGLSIGPFELIHYVKELWITAAGTAYADPIAKALFTANFKDKDKWSSLGCLISAEAEEDRKIDIAIDVEAAEVVLQNLDRLKRNYKRAGLNLKIYNRAA
jgi:6-phosphogluconolactonase/glucosamine-6-phosphate isomerase/deaminase